MDVQKCDNSNYIKEHVQTNGNGNGNYSHLKQIYASNNMECLEGYVLPCPHNYLTLLEKDFEENTYHSIPYNSSIETNTISVPTIIGERVTSKPAGKKMEVSKREAPPIPEERKTVKPANEKDETTEKKNSRKTKTSERTGSTFIICISLAVIILTLIVVVFTALVGKNQNKDLRIDMKVLEENIDATQRQLSKLYISQQNISMLTKKVEQLQKQKGDLVKTMEKMARNNTFLSKENRRLKSKADNVWHLGMNLNPSDGHIMGYVTGWDDGLDIGSVNTSFTKDYLSKIVWDKQVNNIAIVRHQKGLIEAVKVWRFKKKEESMLTKFKAMEPGREIATKGGPKQVFMVRNMTNNDDDPIFSVSGDLAINWWYGTNGVRIALTGGHLSAADEDDGNTHGLGNSFAVDGKTGKKEGPAWTYEISKIQDCPKKICYRSQVKIQGTDHGRGLKSGPAYGNYAIYVSKDARTFPASQKMLRLEMDE